MFNMAGDVIGINSQIFSQSGGNIGIGFAIPATEAKPIIDKLRAGQKIQRGYLGVGIQRLNEDFAAATGVSKDQGEIIGSIEPGGPASRSGLRVGDIVTKVNGKQVNPDQTLSSLVANTAPGSTVRLDVIRENKPVAVTATVGTRPSEDQLAALQGGGDDGDGIPDDDSGSGTAQTAPGSLGLSVQPLTPQIARSLGVDSTIQGVVVAQADPSSDAGQKLKRGDVIQSINSVPVRTAADLARGVASAKAAGRAQVLLLVSRGRGNAIFVPVKIKN
jgi:serine protease Do